MNEQTQVELIDAVKQWFNVDVLSVEVEEAIVIAFPRYTTFWKKEDLIHVGWFLLGRFHLVGTETWDDLRVVKMSFIFEG